MPRCLLTAKPCHIFDIGGRRAAYKLPRHECGDMPRMGDARDAKSFDDVSLQKLTRRVGHSREPTGEQRARATLTASATALPARAAYDAAAAAAGHARDAARPALQYAPLPRCIRHAPARHTRPPALASRQHFRDGDGQGRATLDAASIIR